MLAKNKPIRRVEALIQSTRKEDQHMNKIQRYVGFDVYKDTIAIAVAEAGRAGEVRPWGTLSSDLHALERALRKLRAAGAEQSFPEDDFVQADAPEAF